MTRRATPFRVVEAIDPLPVHDMILAVQQQVEPTVAEPGAFVGQLARPLALSAVPWPAQAIAIARSHR
jgi:hypothetical protein